MALLLPEFAEFPRREYERRGKAGMLTAKPVPAQRRLPLPPISPRPEESFAAPRDSL